MCYMLLILLVILFVLVRSAGDFTHHSADVGLSGGQGSGGALVRMLRVSLGYLCRGIARQT